MQQGKTGKTIYLAGSASKDVNFSMEWREKAEALLPDFKCLSPFRGRDLRNPDNFVEASEIVTRDLDDIHRSDIILAEMVFPDYNYLGTSMEIREAFVWNKPVMIWTPCWQNHYWIKYHATKCMPTLEDLCAYINEFWR